jgi:hypothetical protein
MDLFLLGQRGKTETGKAEKYERAAKKNNETKRPTLALTDLLGPIL